MPIDLVQLSKTMAYALRHRPGQFGLNLDDEGWVPVEDLLYALRKHRSGWGDLQEEDFAAVIEQSEKKRYEIQDGMIRAYYGHSVPQKVVREATMPPEVLFHGTTPAAAASIRAEGLKPMRRQYVHLSEDVETARMVGRRRHERPVILKIHAQQAEQHGVKFYAGNDQVWLADAIPPTFITSL